MDVIIYCNKDGKTDGENTDFSYRIIEICEEDEPQLSDIIKHAMESELANRILEKVHVLEVGEFNEIKSNSNKWQEYITWKTAKMIYEKDKEKFEGEQ